MKNTGQTDDVSVGRRLSACRRMQGVSVDQVASRLNLRPARIRLIEADDFDSLPGPTFVRGYLRGYAKCLGFSEQDILDCYDRQVSEKPESIARVGRGARHHALAGSLFRLAGYAIAVVFLALPGFWWHVEEAGAIDGAVADVIRVDTASGETILQPLEPSSELSFQTNIERLHLPDAIVGNAGPVVGILKNSAAKERSIGKN